MEIWGKHAYAYLQRIVMLLSWPSRHAVGYDKPSMPSTVYTVVDRRAVWVIYYAHYAIYEELLPAEWHYHLNQRKQRPVCINISYTGIARGEFP